MANILPPKPIINLVIMPTPMNHCPFSGYTDIPLEIKSEMGEYTYTSNPLEYAQSLLPLSHQQLEHQAPKTSRRTTAFCILYLTWLLLYIWCNYYQSQGLEDLHTIICLIWPAYLYHAQFWSTLFIIMFQLTPHIAFVFVGYAVAESLLRSPFIQRLKKRLSSRKCSEGLENNSRLGRLQLGLRMFLEVLNYGIVMFWGYVLPLIWPISMLVHAVYTILSACRSSFQA
ncbi:hypothetical protein BGX38DRAFT_117318 [Terfezia claveryi]|nr:hypothetical protein BGX38DRAFT_117318 [Terfezia claveryi]